MAVVTEAAMALRRRTSCMIANSSRDTMSEMGTSASCDDDRSEGVRALFDDLDSGADVTAMVVDEA
jgi:hypothetical protein